MTTEAAGEDGWKHIFSPSHTCPHQQRPSSSMMQVPVPQHLLSSVITSSKGIRVQAAMCHSNTELGILGVVVVLRGLIGMAWVKTVAFAAGVNARNTSLKNKPFK